MLLESGNWALIPALVLFRVCSVSLLSLPLPSSIPCSQSMAQSSFLCCLPGNVKSCDVSLVMSQTPPAVGEESGTETMAENSAFREHWCFPKGKGCIHPVDLGSSLAFPWKGFVFCIHLENQSTTQMSNVSFHPAE